MKIEENKTCVKIFPAFNSGQENCVRTGKGRQIFLCILLVSGILRFKNSWVHIVSISLCWIAFIDHSCLALFLCVCNWYYTGRDSSSVCFDLSVSSFQAKFVNIFIVRSGEELFPCCLSVSVTMSQVTVVAQSVCLISPFSKITSAFKHLCAVPHPASSAAGVGSTGQVLGCAVALRNVPGLPEPRAVPGNPDGSRQLLPAAPAEAPNLGNTAVPGGSTRGQIRVMPCHGDSLPGKSAHGAWGWA